MPPLDYYLLHDRDPGLLVEEFIRAPDHTTVGLQGAVWTRADPCWRGAVPLRADPDRLGRVTPTDRGDAEAAYRELGGGSLPNEAALRSAFAAAEPFPTAVPLRLGPEHAPDGFHEQRVYRVLFAKHLDTERLAAVSASWQPTSRQIGNDLVSWTLRRVGGGIAWGLDVTVLLASDADDTVGPVLRELTAAVRRQGLIPLTTERFS